MSHHARVEELSDSDPSGMDPSDSDPSEMDPSEFDPQSLARMMGGVDLGAGGPSSSQQQQFMSTPQHPITPNAQAEAQHRERSKNWQCVYPVYFDATRTRAEGRRVGKELAVENPLAREIVDAVAALGLQVVFEPGKTHPKDWANPGRVRILLKEDGKPVNSAVKNKHHLYNLVGAYLKAHPTTHDAPMRLRIAGLPPPKELKPPAIPKGWKMNTILPLHSAGLSGGGVSENIFKDMMAEMQGETPGGSASDGGSGPVKKKKDKKKGKA